MKFFHRTRENSQDTTRPLNFDKTAGLSLTTASVRGEGAAGPIEILHSISAQITQQKTAILGLNGSGKSTLLKLFNGLTDYSSGSVSVHGVEVRDHLSEVRKHVGLLFSDPQAQLIMPTPVEDVELSLQHLNFSANQRRARALELLAEKGLADRAEHSVYQLSGGERQLTALVAVLAVEPQVLLLDEPTTLLDLRNKLRLTKLLDALPQQMVISTHDLDLAAQCDEVFIMHDGHLIDHGPANDTIALYRQYCASGFPARLKDSSSGSVAHE